MLPRGPVPSYDAFRARCSFPEAFSGIAQATVEQVLRAKTDYLATAFGDRAVLPITDWSDDCVDAIVHLTFRALMGRRGYDGDSGADKEIIALATQAEAFRKGIQDKTEQPDFIDSHGGPVPDAPRVFSAHAADSWTRREEGRWPVRLRP